jgi:GTP-binding protein
MSSPHTANVEKFFHSPCVFVAGAMTKDRVPPPSAIPEFAFAGRSNVGKSSLLNALVGQKNLVRTSKTPGRTQQINFFALGTRLHLVDLPGYGYAAVGKQKVRLWTELMQDYLQHRSSLRRIFVLIDSRHGIKDNDHEFMDFLDACAVTYQLVLTKTDKLSASALTAMLETVATDALQHPAALPDILATSADKKDGIKSLRQTIYGLL